MSFIRYYFYSFSHAGGGFGNGTVSSNGFFLPQRCTEGLKKAGIKDPVIIGWLEIDREQYAEMNGRERLREDEENIQREVDAQKENT